MRSDFSGVAIRIRFCCCGAFDASVAVPVAPRRQFQAAGIRAEIHSGERIAKLIRNAETAKVGRVWRGGDVWRWMG